MQKHQHITITNTKAAPIAKRDYIPSKQRQGYSEKSIIVMPKGPHDMFQQINLRDYPHLCMPGKK
jgi:hypothetical protein